MAFTFKDVIAYVSHGLVITDQGTTPVKIRKLTPNYGITTGGNTVVITVEGAGATAGGVTVNGNAGTVISWSATEIQFSAPAGPVGDRDVVVTTSDSRTDTYADAYTYYTNGTSDCIKYLIAENIIVALKTVKTANGYNYNVPDENVIIAKEITEISDPSNQSYFVDILDTTPTDDRGHTTEEWYEYLIRFYNVHDSENAAINYDNRNIEADTVKALKVDVNRGGLALFTEKGQSGPAIDMETGAPYQFIHVRCLSTVLANDPYST